MLVASAFLPFLPMLPIHLLVQNLLYDLAQTAIPFDSVDDESLRTPQHWGPHDLLRFMLHFGPVSSVFDVLSFALLWTVLQANTPAMQTLFQTGWFVEGLLSQTLAVLLLRSRGWPFVQSRPAAPLLGAAAMVAAVAVALPAAPLAAPLQMQSLPGVWFGWLVGLMLAYALSLQAMKHHFLRPLRLAVSADNARSMSLPLTTLADRRPAPVAHRRRHLAHGRLAAGTPQQRLRWIEQCVELGVTSFDHADIYGGYQVEALFGEALALAPALRERLQLVSKCGIKLRRDGAARRTASSTTTPRRRTSSPAPRPRCARCAPTTSTCC